MVLNGGAIIDGFCWIFGGLILLVIIGFAVGVWADLRWGENGNRRKS